MNERAQRNESRSGFTLIELMVVIAILGVLAAIVTINLMGASEEGNVAAAKAQISNFKTALMQYKLKYKKFPSSSEGLQALISAKMLDAVAVPKDPWGNDYVYHSPGAQGNDYEIISLGKDGAQGGAEYDADIVSWNLQGASQS
ncbi:MAG: type II secretion system major pseudopilin GspG [Candidatus Hydrogenedentes bacterium]|nr:type II secretion system major pseudopilin GspG [Candidatus Hydrogenedentota bacterium]